MKIKKINPPRKFQVGIKSQITIFDCGSISLPFDHQVTFITENKGEYDVTRKEWGFYATPSINGRLKDFGFATALVKNVFGKNYIMIVEKKMIKKFYKYLKDDNLEVETWLSGLK